MIKRDGVTSIIAGREGFRSAFRSGKRRIRNAAHKKLIQEMRKRGYYKNGKPRQPLPAVPVFDSESCLDWTQVAAGMEEMMKIFTKRVEDLGKSQEPLKFWENPETSQNIPLEHLMAATDLWPLEEVLEMVPNM